MMNEKKLENKEWEVSSAKLQKSHGYADGSGNVPKVLELARRTEELAKDILRLSHHTLFINLRFMEAAFLKIVPGHDKDTLTMATDGRFLYYNAVHICRQYQKEKGIPARDYLHTVLHCVFRHLFVSKKIDSAVWDLSCDIAVENLINKMNLKSLSCERTAGQEWLIRELGTKVPKLSAEWIYRYFKEEKISEMEMEQLRKSFLADDHSIWYNRMLQEEGDPENEERDAADPEDPSGKKTEENQKMGEDTLPDGKEGEDAGSSQEMLAVVESEEGGGIGGDGEGSNDRENKKPALKPAELKEQWKEIAERIHVDLDTFSDSYGEGAGDMQQLLKEINRERYDYAKFLQRFSVTGENVQINDDEFDYIFYTYGLKLYRDMPLVEPLEYKDVKKIREFVIAIDTSESVSGDIVQIFVTKTWNILKQSENFFRKINVHIIQCGARVEEDVRISSQEEFDEYISRMVLKGFGGTDFRPVFERVDQLIRQREFINLKGMIYFTDGYGSFPNNAPAYETAFIFMDQGYELPEVPPWAIKVLLTEDELQML